MKISIVAVFTLLIASATTAQGLPSSSLTRGTWELGVFAGGGDGLGKSDNTQFLVAGGRGGLVLTGEHLPGILRGNFEWAVEVIPVYIVFPPNGGIYGGSVKPFLWEWNFTHFQKVSPFFGVAGGALFTRANIPPGDTSTVNFTPQIDLSVTKTNGQTTYVPGTPVTYTTTVGNAGPSTATGFTLSDAVPALVRAINSA